MKRHAIIASRTVLKLYSAGCHHRICKHDRVRLFCKSISSITSLYRIAFTELLTGIAIPIAGVWLLFARSLRGIGAKFVGCCLALYGFAHFYNFLSVVQIQLGTDVPTPVFGLVEVIFIALIGFGLVIWLLEDERERLHKVNQQLDRFLYSTSHDLRAPISSVLGLINVARYDVSDPKTNEYLSLIEGRVRKTRLGDRRYLALSRVQN